MADYGKTASCCQLVQLSEIRERPEKFQCETCERQAHWEALWPENREAWACYQALTHRTVRDVQAGAWVIERFTTGWSWLRIADLLQRVDLMLSILVPPADHRTQSHGRPTPT